MIWFCIITLFGSTGPIGGYSVTTHAADDCKNVGAAATAHGGSFSCVQGVDGSAFTQPVYVVNQKP